ncbi:hypothetical protein DRJ22_04935 [Candidatus Woesearchaeota archaeon]|nr:MAG: hypothetical protein B6U93_03565 [Candidatus Woesearchaeota archaeon ex4484_78]RLE45222.1 MAG: hypothetical protein DRJ22_04935 [Candidatus Woesearchaeota archaeon]
MKKGQTGDRAAALIGIMLVIFIFYVLFLPPEERTKLLGEDQEKIKIGEQAKEIENTQNLLLSDTIGRLSYIEETEQNHYIPNIIVMESKNAQVLATENTFKLKKGLFTDKTKKMIFTLKQPEKIENPILSFQAPTRKGTLRIVFNSIPLFEGEIQTQNPEPIKIPKELLKTTNTIEFYVIGGFFQKKEYVLTNVKVIGDITETAKQKSRNTFKITKTEYENIKDSYLYFNPYCTKEPTLTITLNGRKIYEATPISNSLNRQELFTDELKEGKNIILFEIDKGKCSIERIKIKNTLKPVKTYLNYFNVNEDLYDKILSKDAHIILKIEFVDDGKTKEAEINVNGIKDIINQKDPEYEKDISKIIKEGNNYIKIKPKTELDINKLEIRIE